MSELVREPLSDAELGLVLNCVNSESRALVLASAEQRELYTVDGLTSSFNSLHYTKPMTPTAIRDYIAAYKKAGLLHEEVEERRKQFELTERGMRTQVFAAHLLHLAEDATYPSLQAIFGRASENALTHLPAPMVRVQVMECLLASSEPLTRESIVSQLGPGTSEAVRKHMGKIAAAGLGVILQGTEAKPIVMHLGPQQRKKLETITGIVRAFQDDTINTERGHKFAEEILTKATRVGNLLTRLPSPYIASREV